MTMHQSFPQKMASPFGPPIFSTLLHIPTTYHHEQIIADFNGEALVQSRELYFYHSALSARHFKGESKSLEVGKSYRVRLFPVTASGVDSCTCRHFLASHAAVLGGLQGLIMLWLLRRYALRLGVRVLSFDSQPMVLDGRALIPQMFMPTRTLGEASQTSFGFALGDRSCSVDDALLCITEIANENPCW